MCINILLPKAPFSNDFFFFFIFFNYCNDNQSVENAGVAFVKGAYERNEFFEKINKR